MITRAIFWIAVVAVFMPHEPDVGFGRPGSDGAAGAGPNAGMASGFRETILSSLDRVKGELKARRHLAAKDTGGARGVVLPDSDAIAEKILELSGQVSEHGKTVVDQWVLKTNKIGIRARDELP